MFGFLKKNKDLENLILKLNMNASNNYKDNAQDDFRRLKARFDELKAAGKLNAKQLVHYGEVRFLMYLGETYHRYIKTNGLRIYNEKNVEIPKPELYVVFTGEREEAAAVMFTFADQVEAMNEALSEERAEGEKKGESRLTVLFHDGKDRGGTQGDGSF